MCARMHTPTDVCGWGRWRADRCLVSDTPGERDSLSFFLSFPPSRRACTRGSRFTKPSIYTGCATTNKEPSSSRASSARRYIHTHALAPKERELRFSRRLFLNRRERGADLIITALLAGVRDLKRLHACRAFLRILQVRVLRKERSSRELRFFNIRLYTTVVWVVFRFSFFYFGIKLM